MWVIEKWYERDNKNNNNLAICSFQVHCYADTYTISFVIGDFLFWSVCEEADGIGEWSTRD